MALEHHLTAVNMTLLDKLLGGSSDDDDDDDTNAGIDLDALASTDEAQLRREQEQDEDIGAGDGDAGNVDADLSDFIANSDDDDGGGGGIDNSPETAFRLLVDALHFDVVLSGKVLVTSGKKVRFARAGKGAAAAGTLNGLDGAHTGWLARLAAYEDSPAGQAVAEREGRLRDAQVFRVIRGWLDGHEAWLASMTAGATAPARELALAVAALRNVATEPADAAQANIWFAANLVFAMKCVIYKRYAANAAAHAGTSVLQCVAHMHDDLVCADDIIAAKYRCMKQAIENMAAGGGGAHVQ